MTKYGILHSITYYHILKNPKYCKAKKPEIYEDHKKALLDQHF